MGPNFDLFQLTNIRATVCLLLVLCVAVGCSRNVPDATSSPEKNTTDSLFDLGGRNYTTVSAMELGQLIRKNSQPVLVEYGVDLNCARCDKMTPVINQLAEQFQGQAHVVRTQFNPTSAPQAQQNIRICPTYHLYSNGKLVEQCEGPTMLPVLKSKLSRLVSRNASSNTSTSQLTTEEI